MDGKVQAGMARLFDWHAIKIKNVAAQGKWQGGITERQINKWFKGIWDRVVHELSIDESEVEIAATLVRAAKNDLRRRGGHSPTQCSAGRPGFQKNSRTPRMARLLPGMSPGIRSSSDWQQCEQVREWRFTKPKEKDRLRRALMQRARTAKRDFDIGEPVHFWNQPRTGDGLTGMDRPLWLGGKVPATGCPAVAAAEHLRASGPDRRVH